MATLKMNVTNDACEESSHAVLEEHKSGKHDVYKRNIQLKNIQDYIDAFAKDSRKYSHLNITFCSCVGSMAIHIPATVLRKLGKDGSIALHSDTDDFKLDRNSTICGEHMISWWNDQCYTDYCNFHLKLHGGIFTAPYKSQQTAATPYSNVSSPSQVHHEWSGASAALPKPLPESLPEPLCESFPESLPELQPEPLLRPQFESPVAADEIYHVADDHAPDGHAASDDNGSLFSTKPQYSAGSDLAYTYPDQSDPIPVYATLEELPPLKPAPSEHSPQNAVSLATPASATSSHTANVVNQFAAAGASIYNYNIYVRR